MSYSITASKLKQICGHTLHLKTRDGSDATIRIPTQPTGWPRGGVEAYGLKAELEVNRVGGAERIPAFVKIFKTEVRQREQRTRLLIEMELAKQSDFFYGVPFGWLGRININGIDIIAHFTRMIRGPYDGGPEDFGRLRSDGRWVAFDEGQRFRFAGELAAAVAGLERAGLVHGDISPGNILVGTSGSNNTVCILCDYDGYHHDLVPRLPRKDGPIPCRPLGNPGYQYPDLITALKADLRNDADVWVATDRFALGVAICEMVVWSEDVEKVLQKEGRGQLLPDDVIVSRDLSRMPTRIIDSFPSGFLLLDKALRASAPSAMPSPEDWLRVLGFDAEPWVYHGHPTITVFQGRGTTRAKRGTFRVTREKGGIPLVMGLLYEFADQKLEFSFPANLSVKRRRDGRIAHVTTGIGAVAANPGDTYYVGDLQIEIMDFVENVP